MENTSPVNEISQAPTSTQVEPTVANYQIPVLSSNPKNLPLVLGGILLVTLVSAGSYYLGTQASKTTVQPKDTVVMVTPDPTIMPKACTEEAKICPDGSAVGRSGPNCEFAPCPTETRTQSNLKEGWKTYTDDTYTFQYPDGKWNIQPGSNSSEKYFGGDMVTIVTPDPAVTAQVTTGRQPYGFGGDIKAWDGETITVTVNGQKFSGKEMLREEDGVTKVFVDMPITLGSKTYYIMLGTGYPINNDATASYASYQQFKPTLLEILSTLNIANNQ